MSLNENEVYEVQVYTRKYQIGTCFTCQKCLYCGKDLLFVNCHCNKYEKPAKNNRTAKVRGYRSLCYDTSNAQPFLKEFMSRSNLKFGYEVNLETSFYCSLYTACNSKISRENNKFEKEIKKEESSDLMVVNPVTELQLRISIKNGKELLPSILVNCNEYFLAYKGNSEVGAETLLDNEITFEEFLKDYQHYISNKKKDDNLENTASEETEEEIPKPKSAQDIFKNNTDFETPPNHAIFSMLHSVKPVSYNSSNLNSNENSLLPTPNIIQNYISEVSSMNEFLKELDGKYGANKFTCYLQNLRMKKFGLTNYLDYLMQNIIL
ncbi:unnamed protein product [Rhizophagus irregularis]|nr:unnamed protein product [Rhizophagus irregularis]